MIANAFADHLSRISNDEAHSQQFLNHKLFNETHLDLNEEVPQLFKNDFTIYELQKAIASANNCTPGEDQFHTQFLQNAPVNIIQIQLDICNQRWRQYNFPHKLGVMHNPFS